MNMVDRVIHKFVLWFSDNPFYQFFLKYKKLIVAVLITAILALSKEMILLNEEAMLLRAYLPWIYVYERIAYTLAAIILFILLATNVYLSGIYSDLHATLERRMGDVVYQGKTFVRIQGWGYVTVDRHLPEVRSLGGNFRWNFYCEKTNTIDNHNLSGGSLSISPNTYYKYLAENDYRVIDVADFYVCQGSDGISSPQFCGQLSLYEDDESGKRILMGYGRVEGGMALGMNIEIRFIDG